MIQRAKQMANEIQESSDLWELESYLTQRRKEIDRKYDYRYSQLRHVFGRLLYEGRLNEQGAARPGRRQVEINPLNRQIPS